MGRTYERHDPETLAGPHVRQTLPQVTLEILRGRAKRRIRAVTGPAFLIGAARDSDLVLGDPRFPEAHSYLLLEPDGVALRWLGFGPEIFVNGQEVRRARLGDGDLLTTGPYEFRIAVGGRDSENSGSCGPTSSRRRLQSRGESKGRVDPLPPAASESALAQIHELLSDIRESLAASRAGLRLYVGSKTAPAPVAGLPRRPTPVRAVRVSRGR